jgi:serine/threonine protein kinase
MSFVNPEPAQVWHPVSRPSNVQRLYSLSEDLEWSGNAFEIGSQIGSGSFATVFLGTYNGTGQQFAIKKVPMPSGQHFRRQKESLEREIMVLRDCRSPYIVSYFGSFEERETSNMCIVMEFLAGGTLQDVIKEYDQHGGLDEPSMHGIMTSVLKGLAYLHDRNIMHRDLKSKNILIDTDGSTKLADFGVSRELNQSGMARSMVGTPLFMAPEVLEGEAYSAVADVWSLGIVALHIANGEIPRRGTAVRELMRMVVAQPAPKLQEPKKWSASLGEFIEACLVKDPSRRATCPDLLESEWVVGTAEDCEATKVNMKNRTIGRASQYMSPVKQPRAGAQSSTPSRRPKLKDISLQQQQQQQQQTPVKTSRKEISTAATTSVKETNQHMIANPTPEQLEGFQDQEKDAVVKELLGWKQLALKLLDEREGRTEQ